MVSFLVMFCSLAAACTSIPPMLEPAERKLIPAGTEAVKPTRNRRPTKTAPEATASTSSPPLYPLKLTIIIHTEEDLSEGNTSKSHIPDYDGDRELMLHFTQALRAFAEMAQSHGAKINFGSDWTFSKGVQNFDPTFYADLEGLGHEIDAHAHESFILYPEVRQEIINAGGHPTRVASGMNEKQLQKKMNDFDQVYPHFRFLWGVSLPGHGPGECVASWVWRPSRQDWETHDPAGKYIYIGPGQQVNSLEALEEAIQNREPGRLHTYAVFLSPRSLKASKGSLDIDPNWTTKPVDHDYWENRLAWWDEFLTEIDTWVAEGSVEYASLTEIAAQFEAVEDHLVLDDSRCPRSEEGLLARNRAAGYYP
jgi:hypothetical protein